MKIAAIVTLTVLTALGALPPVAPPRPQRISAAEAKDHIGETRTVCGEVASTRYVEQSSGSPTFLNLDRPYPNRTFTIVIWGKDRMKFNTPEDYYRDMPVCVTGKIEAYQGDPQIVARERRQIQLDCDCTRDRYNCSDFSTQAKAQQVYDCCWKKVERDVHRLDRDRDGRVCEELPRR